MYIVTIQALVWVLYTFFERSNTVLNCKYNDVQWIHFAYKKNRSANGFFINLSFILRVNNKPEFRYGVRDTPYEQKWGGRATLLNNERTQWFSVVRGTVMMRRIFFFQCHRPHNPRLWTFSDSGHCETLFETIIYWWSLYYCITILWAHCSHVTRVNYFYKFSALLKKKNVRKIVQY